MREQRTETPMADVHRRQRRQMQWGKLHIDSLSGAIKTVQSTPLRALRAAESAGCNTSSPHIAQQSKYRLRDHLLEDDRLSGQRRQTSPTSYSTSGMRICILAAAALVAFTIMLHYAVSSGNAVHSASRSAPGGLPDTKLVRGSRGVSSEDYGLAPPQRSSSSNAARMRSLESSFRSVRMLAARSE